MPCLSALFIAALVLRALPNPIAASTSREYGLHAMEIPRLSGQIEGVRALRLRTKLIVALVKGGGSYRRAPWDKLQADQSKPDLH